MVLHAPRGTCTHLSKSSLGWYRMAKNGFRLENYIGSSQGQKTIRCWFRMSSGTAGLFADKKSLEDIGYMGQTRYPWSICLCTISMVIEISSITPLDLTSLALWMKSGYEWLWLWCVHFKFGFRKLTHKSWDLLAKQFLTVFNKCGGSEINEISLPSVDMG